MKQQDWNETIEQYLSGALSPEATAAFEAQLARDGALRRELELHRQLQQDFNASRLNLRANLQKIMQEPLPPEQGDKPRGSARWWLWLPGILGLLFLVWHNWPLRKPNPESPPEVPPSAAPTAPAIDTPQKIQPPPASNTPPASRPMASADPADFIPNRGMEAFVNGNFRSEAMAFNLNSPRNGLEIVPNPAGVVSLQFNGYAEAPAGAQPKGFMLSFFNNRDGNNPLRSMPLPIENTVEGRLKIKHRQELNLKPGLYYFTVETLDSGELLYAGKFFVRQ